MPRGSIVGVEKLETLADDFRDAAKRVCELMVEKGWKVRVLYARRSKAENDILVARGYASPHSKHLTGHAVDLINRDNPYPKNKADPYYIELSQAVEAEGLNWGGNFHSRWDPTHFEAKG